ncbi:MAG TPA: alpha/beta hydrolase [Syntrophobacteraceae bacterium]|nr:alpha/beta hydrolase [Syntrophobacteraceae bacterium]
MNNPVGADYVLLDSPAILSRLFYPREDWRPGDWEPPGEEVAIPVEEGVEVGGRFHLSDPHGCNLLFFHGNGEIVADYDDIAPIFGRMGINFLPVDYRGYGRSGGSPSASSMMRDSHEIFRYVRKWLDENKHSGPLMVMGRSLGSASALELAFHYPEQLDAVIVESGFAYTMALLRFLGVDVEGMGLGEADGFGNIEKIRSFGKPTLLIHAELDSIIPFSDAQALFDACGARDKTLVKIEGADHNNLFLVGLPTYLSSLKTLADKVKAGT